MSDGKQHIKNRNYATDTIDLFRFRVIIKAWGWWFGQWVVVCCCWVGGSPYVCPFRALAPDAHPTFPFSFHSGNNNTSRAPVSPHMACSPNPLFAEAEVEGTCQTASST